MSEQAFGETLKFYRDWDQKPQRRTALNAQFVETRQNVPSVQFELAPIPKAGAAASWSDKITLQLSREELAGCCSVLLGRRNSFEGSFHGDAKNKGFQIRSGLNQGALIILSQAGRNMMHILSSVDRMTLCAFLVRRLAMSWQLPPAAVIEIIRGCEDQGAPVVTAATGSENNQ